MPGTQKKTPHSKERSQRFRARLVTIFYPLPETRGKRSLAGTRLTSPSSEITSERPLAALSSTNFREASVIPFRILSDNSSSSDLLVSIFLFFIIKHFR